MISIMSLIDDNRLASEFSTLAVSSKYLQRKYLIETFRRIALSKDWEKKFSFWAQPPSQSEQDRCDRVIRAIREGINQSQDLKKMRIQIFTQGSFRNRVNVRQGSDVDVGVMLYNYFLPSYPIGMTAADFGNISVNYPFSQYKNQVGEALVKYFGRTVVKRGNKAFNIKSTTIYVEADVVPLFEYRNYRKNGSYHAGVTLIPDNDSRHIINYPERLADYWPNTPLHYENGIQKNSATKKRFKGMVRILKKLRIELGEDGNRSAGQLPGYLVECLVWNAPNRCFSGPDWEERVQSVLQYLWQNTLDYTLCKNWREVDNIKSLFHNTQPWAREQANKFIESAWNYVGVKSFHEA